MNNTNYRRIIKPPGMPISRRAFSTLLLSAGTLAWGSGDKRDHMAPFHWTRVKFDNVGNNYDRWDVNPQADVLLLRRLKEATGLNIDTTRYVVTLDNLEEMYHFPLLFMTSDGTFDFKPNQQANLVEYLKRGGFLLADDCVANGGGRIDAFFLDFRSKIEHLFGQKMVRLPDNHEIYRSFYNLPNGLPHMQGVKHGGHALFLDGRMAVYLSPSDIHCGWQDQIRKENGIATRYAQSDDAPKMGINLFMYLMSH